jgi:hypothetical protein
MKTASERKIMAKFAKVLGELLFIYGLLAWLDGVVIQFAYPNWLPRPVSHLLPWMRTDTFTILSFFVSALGFLIWRLTVELTRPEQTKAN